MLSISQLCKNGRLSSIIFKERWENKKGKRKWKKTFKNGVEFNHPGRQNRLFGETVDIGQRTNPTLDTQSENISKVLRREAASGDGVEDSVGAQEKFRVTLNGVVKSLVGQDGRLSFQEALHSSHTTFDAMTPETKRLRNHKLLTNTWCVKSKREWDLVFFIYLEALLERLELLLGDFELSLGHVGRLFGVERVGDATWHKDVQLETALPLLLLALLSIPGLEW